jgi:hypothetical protein
MRRQMIIGLSLAGMLVAAGCTAAPGDNRRSPLEVGSTSQADASPTATEGSTPGTNPAGTPTATDGEPASGSSSYSAGDAGTVTLAVEGRSVALEGVQVAANWQQVGEPRASASELRIDFAGPNNREIRFEAEVERDGTLDIDVKERRPHADGTVTIDLPEGAGRATFTVAGQRITLDGVAPADGWEVRGPERDDDSFEVDVVNADRQIKVELEAEIDDGRLELEIETRYGPGHERGDDDDDDDADDD